MFLKSFDISKGICGGIRLGDILSLARRKTGRLDEYVQNSCHGV
jgi:hypothetical protein